MSSPEPLMSSIVIASRTRKRQTRTKRRGQALVEFALVVPVFLILLFGIIDVARLVFESATLSQAAREGARVGAVEAGWLPPNVADSACNLPNGPVCPPDVATLRADITSAANREMQPFGTVANVYTSCDVTTAPTGTWVTTTCANPKTGNLVSVRVTSTWRPITPIISSFINSIPLSASATMVTN